MNIAIIGAGFTGLSAAYSLSKKGHRVAVFETDSQPGGLAVGFKLPNWTWSIEKHYHHWFTNDNSVLDLASEIGQKVETQRPKTSVFLDGQSYQLDSPLNLLSFPKLSSVERLRMAAVLGFLRLNPYWKPLENYSAHSFLSATMGKRAYEMIWDPQLSNKFGIYKKDISLAWFWARVHKRTASLSYPSGGYLGFAQKLVEKIERFSGKVYFNTSVSEIIKLNLIRVTYREGQEKIVTSDFDSVIVTTPGFIFSKIAPQLPAQYVRTLVSLKGLGAVNLILRLKKPLMRDGTYWLSICEKNSPVMAVVEHTNFMSKKWYDNEHIVYIGNYVDHSHPYFSMNEHELLERFDKTLKTLRDDYQSDIIGMHSFKAYFAQPIIPKKYSHTVPSIQTPISNVYLANMQQIYPWDRGTNYAVELGNRVADLLLYEHSNRS